MYVKIYFNSLVNVFEYLWIPSDFTWIEQTLDVPPEICHLFQPFHLGRWHCHLLRCACPRLMWYLYFLPCHHPHQQDPLILFSEDISRWSASLHLQVSALVQAPILSLLDFYNGLPIGSTAASPVILQSSLYRTASIAFSDINMILIISCLKSLHYFLIALKKKKVQTHYHGLPSHDGPSPCLAFHLIWYHACPWPPYHGFTLTVILCSSNSLFRSCLRACAWAVSSVRGALLGFPYRFLLLVFPL